MSFPKYLCLALVALASAVCAQAHEYDVAALKIDHPWARPTVAAAQPGAAFFTVTNTGNAPDRLIAARAPDGFLEGIEIHTTRIGEDGVARMRPLADGALVEPGETLVFAPGGRHLMLFGLGAPLEDGESFPLTLVFERAGEVDVVVKVETNPEAGAGHAGH